MSACAAFLFAGQPAAAWNAGIAGLLIVCCSAMALYRYDIWAEWSNLTLGCWVMAAPFLLGFGAVQTPMWTHALIGLCIATIAIVQIAGDRKARGFKSDAA